MNDNCPQIWQEKFGGLFEIALLTRADNGLSNSFQKGTNMTESTEFTYPEIVTSDFTEGVVLVHPCGVSFAFYYDEDDDENRSYVQGKHLEEWGISLKKLAEIVGNNCFETLYLEPKAEGVWESEQAMSILFNPATYMEHTAILGRAQLLIIGEEECIITGTGSEEGQKILAELLDKADAKEVVYINEQSTEWVAKS